MSYSPLELLSIFYESEGVKTTTKSSTRFVDSLSALDYTLIQSILCTTLYLSPRADFIVHRSVGELITLSRISANVSTKLSHTAK
jgi:hypothetical protein